MDESNNGKIFNMREARRALYFVFFFMLLSFFLIYNYTQNTSSVSNENPQAQAIGQEFSDEELLEKIKQDSGSEFFGKYLDKIREGNSAAIEKSAQDELNQITQLPEQIIFLQKPTVGNSFAEKALYLNQFEELMVEARKKGVFSESAIFAAQTQDFLTLSDYDKATILRIATDYELWAEKILELETPEIYENKSLAAAGNILNAAYILRKIVEEEDSQIFVMWIGKYAETIFDILATRYVK